MPTWERWAFELPWFQPMGGATARADSAAGTDSTAGRAEVAAVLADHRVVAAVAAQFALGR